MANGARSENADFLLTPRRLPATAPPKKKQKGLASSAATNTQKKNVHSAKQQLPFSLFRWQPAIGNWSLRAKILERRGDGRAQNPQRCPGRRISPTAHPRAQRERCRHLSVAPGANRLILFVVRLDGHDVIDVVPRNTQTKKREWGGSDHLSVLRNGDGMMITQYRPALCCPAV